MRVSWKTSKAELIFTDPNRCVTTNVSSPENEHIVLGPNKWCFGLIINDLKFNNFSANLLTPMQVFVLQIKHGIWIYLNKGLNYSKDYDKL